MKKIAIYFLILNCFNGVYGQKDTTKTDFKRFQVGVNFSPNTCYRILTDANDAYGNLNIINIRNKSEIMKFGYTTGLSFVFNFKRWVGIELGAQYNNQGYKTRKNIPLYNPQTNILTPSSTHVDYVFNYMDIPVKINFIVGHKKVRFFSSIGISANFLLRATQTSFIDYGGSQPNKTVKYVNNKVKAFNISPFMSVGIDYQIKDFFTLRIAPTFRYGVLSTNNAPINEYLLNAGCNVACYFNF